MAAFSRASLFGWAQGDDASDASRPALFGWEQINATGGATHNVSAQETVSADDAPDATVTAGSTTHNVSITESGLSLIHI